MDWSEAGEDQENGERRVTQRRQRAKRQGGLDSSPGPGYIVLTFEFHKEGGMWVGECRELGTATDGRSLERVEDELVNLVLLHLYGLEEIGERERVLAERGITLYPTEVPDHVDRSVPVNSLNRLIQARSIRVPVRERQLAAV
jgi:hypothetical protein